MSILLREKILYRDHKKTMDAIPRFSIEKFAERVRRLVLKHRCTFDQYQDVVDAFEDLRKKYVKEQHPTRVARLRLAQEVEREAELEKAKNHGQAAPRNDALAGLVAMQEHRDYASDDSGGSDEDIMLRELNDEQRERFALALERDICRYLKYLTKPVEKYMWANTRILASLQIPRKKRKDVFKFCYRTGSLNADSVSLNTADQPYVFEVGEQQAANMDMFVVPQDAGIAPLLVIDNEQALMGRILAKQEAGVAPPGAPVGNFENLPEVDAQEAVIKVHQHAAIENDIQLPGD